MPRTRVYRKQINQLAALFCCRKTASQATGTTGAGTVITWQTKEEWNGDNNISIAGNSWTAPADGWLDTTCSLSVIGGTGADDSMVFYFTKNGSVAQSNWDNWLQFSPSAGVEYPTSCHAAFAVSAGDVIQVCFSGTQNNVTIQAGASGIGPTWTGRFFPNII